MLGDAAILAINERHGENAVLGAVAVQLPFERFRRGGQTR
ncbi:hypothetical protein SDC9_199873 [bioreactor metagenome]|uniref:Uncharacterized protein n=1 Tax=bioreactor metagenome TaxID=1076179 RepID=A0A645ILS9_9ZZZZ